MSNKKRIVESAKNLTIVLLMITSMLLGWKTELFSEFLGSIPYFSKIAEWSGNLSGGMDDDNNNSNEGISSESERPIYIAVTDDEGDHYGVRYDLAALNSLYENTGGFFYEALGSAAEPSEIDADTWRAALTSLGLYFDYFNPVPISVIAKWLGTEISENWGDTFVRRFCVAASGENVCLYYQNAENGLYYCAETAVTKSNMLARIGSYQSNGVKFAFEIEALTSADEQYQILFTETSEHPVIIAANPLLSEETAQTVLDSLGVSENPNSPYTEVDGTRVYVENDFTLRLRTDGTVVYKRTDTSYMSDSNVTKEEVVETSYGMIMSTIWSSRGDADVKLKEISYENAGKYIVTFEYWVAGGRVYMNDDGYAARVVVENGQITELVLIFRTYEITSNTKDLLPEIQACAISGGEIILNYSDFNTETLYPEWAVN